MTEETSQGVHFIREVAIRYRRNRQRTVTSIGSPQDVCDFAQRVVQDDAREHFLAIYLDGRHVPIAYQIVSVGVATASLVHPREVFQPGVLVGACAILVAHNHPSGNPSPSREDSAVTRRLARSGALLGIALLDHVVWTRDGGFTSMRESRHDAFDGGAAA